MDICNSVRSIWMSAFLCYFALAQSAIAGPVWHCSRSHVQIADASDDFTLAALTVEREVIKIALQDLYGVFREQQVRMNGNLLLSACVIAAESKLTTSALQTIGVKPPPFGGWNPEKKIRTIHLVHDESEMQACISKNHPAIGYLAVSTHTEDIGPCF